MNKLKRVFFALFIMLITAGIAGASFFLHYTKNLPNLSQIEHREITQSTKIYDRTGEVLLYEIHGEERRTVIPFEEIPDYLKNATIVVEDDNFYNHPAFDWRAILRAITVDVLSGRVVQGGSTITQQLVKNAFLTPEKRFSRKIKELSLALKMEQRYTKNEILNLYLNQVPYGSNAYGIEAASITFFEKSAKELSLAEATLLAALPRRPSYYSPYGTHYDELKARQEFILEKMFLFGYIDEEELDRAKEVDLKFSPPRNEIIAPHFVMYVREHLNNKYGEEFVEKGGLKVITTLNLEYQQIAENAVLQGVERNKELYNGNNASMVVQDTNTGQILALVGSVDYFDVENEGNFNVATQGLRQPGSAFKPFVYLTAFKKGYLPETMVFDTETEFNTTEDEEKSYKPSNYDKKYRGPISLRDALAQSVNVPSVKTLYLAGINDTIDTAEQLGISTLTDRSRYGMSLVLGGGEITLIDLVGAYSVFAEEGIKHDQTIILSVEGGDGKLLEEYSESSQKVFESNYINMLNDVLSDNDARAPLFGRNSLLLIDNHQIAAKTGTTNDFRDAWTIGYTPSIVAGVWVGNNNNSPMNVGGVSILAATPIWNAFMKEALIDKPTELFNKPQIIPTDKQMLNGEYIVKHPIGNNDFPHIHTILYYINKKDPLKDPLPNPALDIQFINWEKPVLNWVKTNISDYQNYNKPVPNIYNIIQDGNYMPSISFELPENGGFISNELKIRAKAFAPIGIQSIKLYLNENLMDSVLISTENEDKAINEILSPKPQSTSTEKTSLINNIYTENTNHITEYEYTNKFNVDLLLLQNSLKIELSDLLGNKNSEEIIVFK